MELGGALLDHADVRDLAESWFHALERLVRLALNGAVVSRTPSDVPLVALSQAELDRLEKAQARWARPCCRRRKADTPANGPPAFAIARLEKTRRSGEAARAPG